MAKQLKKNLLKNIKIQQIKLQMNLNTRGICTKDTSTKDYIENQKKNKKYNTAGSF